MAIELVVRGPSGPLHCSEALHTRHAHSSLYHSLQRAPPPTLSSNPPLPFTLTHSLLHSNSRVVCSKAPAAAGTAVEEMRSCNQLSLTPVDERLAHHSSLKVS